MSKPHIKNRQLSVVLKEAQRALKLPRRLPTEADAPRPQLGRKVPMISGQMTLGEGDDR
jgi:hypothetical protein